MMFAATMGERHQQIPSYTYEKFAEYASSFGIDKIIVSSYSAEDVKNGLGKEISALLEKKKFDVSYCGCDFSETKKKEGELIRSRSEDPDFVTNKNMLEMIDTTVWTYLQAYWTTPQSVNSETTDSIFQTKRLMQTSLIPELESEIWLPVMNKTVDEIRKISDYGERLILVDVESAFFLKKRL